MPIKYRCALAPFRVQGDATAVHLFHVPLTVPGARLFGFVIGAEATETARINSVIQELAARFKAASGVTVEELAGQFFKQANRAVRDLPLKSFARKQAPVASALAAITFGQQIALAGRGALAFRVANASQVAAPTDLLGPEPADSKTIFPTLVVGGLGKRETLLLASRTLLDFCAPAHLGRLMNAGSAEATREALLNLLQDLQPTTAIAGVVIKAVPADSIMFQHESPTDSLNTLLKQARETEALLAPAFLPSVSRLFRRFASATRRGGFPGRPLLRGSRIVFTIPRLGVQIIRYLRHPRETIRAFTAIPPRTKVRLIVVSLAIIVTAAGAVTLYVGHVRRRELREIAHIAEQLLTKRAAIEASMLYGDETAAWNNYDEARALLANLPGSSRRIRTFKQLSGSELEADARRLRHEVIIEQPTAVADQNPFPNSPLPSTVAVYNSRQYEVRTAAGMILRAGAPWLAAPVEELRRATSLAVESSVYTGTDDGRVLAFHKGARADFPLGRMDPPLGAIARMIVPEGSSFLYLLVPTTNRVVVLDRKRAAVAAQYTSPAFGSLTDLSVDEPLRMIYVKNDATMYAIPAAHLP